MKPDPLSPHDDDADEAYHPALDRLMIIVFLAILCAPMAARVLHLAREHETMRFDSASARPPTLTWNWRYPRELEQYLNTHFGFRDELTELHALFKVKGFGVSSSDTVTIGKDGWLFYAGEDIIDDYRRVRPFTEDELAQWTRLLTRRRDWLRDRGVQFLFFIVPNQQTIYPELMPAWMWRTENPSRLDQLMRYLETHSDLEVLDVRAELRAAKATRRLYYATDSHWNQNAGFIAYQQIAAWMKQRFPRWRSFGDADFTRTETAGWHGGLTYLLGMPSLFSETRVDILPREPGHVTTDGQPLPADETIDAWTKRPIVVRESDDGEIPSAVFFRDSQLAAPGQFLSRHFRRSVFVWSRNFDTETIEREHPSVVIEEFAERFLMQPLPKGPKP